MWQMGLPFLPGHSKVQFSWVVLCDPSSICSSVAAKTSSSVQLIEKNMQQLEYKQEMWSHLWLGPHTCVQSSS